MTDWRAVSNCYLMDGRLLDDQGEAVALVTGSTWRETLAWLLSANRSPRRLVTDPAGTPLFSFQSKEGSFRSWIKVMSSDGVLIARIDRDGTIFTKWKEQFTIRNAVGDKVGRIDNPMRGHEFVAFNSAGARIARGIRRGVSGWEVWREPSAEPPWPELIVAFFCSVLDLIHRHNS